MLSNHLTNNKKVLVILHMDIVSYEITKTECTDVKYNITFPVSTQCLHVLFFFSLNFFTQKTSVKTVYRAVLRTYNVSCIDIRKRASSKAGVFVFACFELLTMCKSFVFFHKPAPPSLRYLPLPGLCSSFPSQEPSRWPSVKASASRAEDPGFESHFRQDFAGRVIPVT